MITTFYPPYNFGGDGIFAYRLSNELAVQGHQVDVIHCKDAYTLLARKRPTDRVSNHSNITVHGLKSPLGFLSPILTQQTGAPFLKSAALKKILHKRFDVIHYHNISLIGGPGILTYGRGLKLYTLCEYWLVCPMHVLFRLNRKRCIRRTCLLCSLIHRRPPQLWRYTGLIQRAVKHIDAFISPSRFCMEKHGALGMDLPYVHLPYFSPKLAGDYPGQPENIPNLPEKPYFLFVGRLEKIKGLQTLIPVFNGDPRAHLLIAGRGGYESQLRRMASKHPHIHFMGSLSSFQLRTLYQQAVAVIVPSICYDIFPNVILEAYTCRTPVIARNLGGMPEFLNESNSGIIYDTEEDLRRAMRRLLNDPSYRRKLGDRGYQACRENYTRKVHMEKYLALINHLRDKFG
jgi:glycosyltransferase involved in cell wall biosynthesis